jgi:hypothetical protein
VVLETLEDLGSVVLEGLEGLFQGILSIRLEVLEMDFYRWLRGGLLGSVVHGRLPRDCEWSDRSVHNMVNTGPGRRKGLSI